MFATFSGYLYATLVCAVTTALGVPLGAYLDLANIIMLFLLGVVAVALYLGRGPSVWAAILSVACFDFFFVPPKYSFSVDDEQYLLTFAVMLAVALIIGQLTARLSEQAQAAAKRARCGLALHQIAREIGGVSSVSALVQVAGTFLRDGMDAQGALLMPDAAGRLATVGTAPEHLHIAPLMASLAYNNTPCTDLDAPYPTGYLPLAAVSRVRGVLIVISPSHSALPLHEHKEFLETVASLVAIVLERLHVTDAAHA